MNVIDAKLNAKNSLFHELYEKAALYYRQILSDLIYDNNCLHYDSVNYGSITYKGKRYKYIPFTTYVYRKGHELDETLTERMEKYVEGTEKLQAEGKRSKRFLTILFNFCRSNDDINRLLGDSLHQYCINYSRMMYGTSRPIQEIEEFKLQYQNYLDILNERFVENMIMAGIYSNG